MTKEKIYIFDTTLRDGAQTEGVDFSLEDKNKIAQVLADLGVDYIEGGWPGANPTDDEFFQVAQWIWENFDICSGISLLPYSDHVYQQAPYEEINKKQYTEMLKTMPKNVDWVNELKAFEDEDNTIGSQELACVGGACEIV